MKTKLKKLTLALAFAPLTVQASGDWIISNSRWDGIYPSNLYSGSSECIDEAIAAWHRGWPGYMHAIFTVTTATDTQIGLNISNGASGWIGCERVSVDDAANDDSPPPPPPPDTPPDTPPPDAPPDDPPMPPEDPPPPLDEPGRCTPNPIQPAKAAKRRFETDWVDGGPSPISFTRIYNSKFRGNKGIGYGWTYTYGAKLAPYPTSSPLTATIQLPEGDEYLFTKLAGTSVWKPTNGNDSLIRNPDLTWTWRRTNNDTLWTFSSVGALLSIQARNGWTTQFAYTVAGQLSTVTNHFGRQITLTYNSDNLISSLTTADSRTISYGYDTAKRLTTVTYPDNKQRTFLYENITYPRALTGIIDENNVRWGTFTYDTSGRAVKSELAGGVSKYEVTYPAAKRAQIKDPAGVTRTYNYSTAGGSSQVASSSTASGSGTSIVASRTISTQGLTTAETDFRGAVKTTAWDTTRFLQTSVVEGASTVLQRTTNYSWHPTLRLPTQISKGGRTTSYTYDAQGRALTEAVTDNTVTPATSRTNTWTYNSQGLVQTATAADGSSTSFTYDSLGNRLSKTNSLAQTTNYTWDGANRIASITQPNGRITSYTWDLRDRLQTQTTDGLVTSFVYRPSGQVSSITYPAGLIVTYSYDNAQRLTGWTDNRGNSGVFQLDAAGNRTKESVLDNGSVKAFEVQRSINALNRVGAETLGSNIATSYQYDSNGDLISTTNALGQTTSYVRDALRRIDTITNPLNQSAELDYNVLDSITAAEDFNGVLTEYVRDVVGNAKQETSPDSGASASTFDARGLLASKTDATGRSIGVERDLLGRVTKLNYNDSTSSLLKYDLVGSTYNELATPNASIGSLSEVQDPAVTTQYQRDGMSRIVRKTQILTGGDTRSGSYTYVPAGQGGAGSLQSITYPSGKTLSYTYDATGQVTGMSWNGTPVVTDLQWNPLGMPIYWKWPGIKLSPSDPSPLLESREYNTAGQLIHSGLLDLTWDAAGRVTAIAQNHMIPASGSDPAQRAMVSSSFNYNTNGNLTGSAHALMSTPVVTLPSGVTLPDLLGYTSIGYSYDANGNRTGGVFTQDTGSATPITITRTYTTTTGTNRLASVSSTGSAGTAIPTKTYQYDASGSLTSAAGQYLHYGPNGRVAKLTGTASSSDPLAVSYVYNSSSQRVLKTDTRTAGTTLTDHTFYSDEDGTSPLGFYSNQRSSTSAAPAGENDSTEILYLPTANGLMPIAAQINGRIYAIDTDHLNTPRRLTDADGQVTWQWLITGFGEVSPTTGANGYLQPGSAATAPSYAPAVTFNLRYPGQQWDQETGLAYNINRYYDASSGRYIQADPIGLGGGWNRFAYVNGNPLSYTDPTGKIAIAPVIAWGIPIVAGITWGLTNKKPRWPPWGGGNDENTGGESWPKENKEFCIRTYANCVNYGWTGRCQSCLDQCIASGSGDWPFDQCKPKKNGNMCEP